MAVESNNEPRSLRVLRIHDADFMVDIRNLEFIQVDNHENRISFRDVRDLGFHTEVTYDPLTKNAFKGTLAERLSRNDLIEVKLPAAIDFDTQQLADEITVNVRKQRDFKNTLDTSPKSDMNRKNKRTRKPKK